MKKILLEYHSYNHNPILSTGYISQILPNFINLLTFWFYHNIHDFVYIVYYVCTKGVNLKITRKAQTFPL